jgi:integrase
VRDQGEKKTYLTLWRRHKTKCPHKEDRYYRKCRCAVWCEGTLQGEYRRHSLKTRSWEHAVKLARDIENGLEPTEPGITIAEAFIKFISDCAGRKLKANTIAKYKRLQTRLNNFASVEGITQLSQLTIEQADAFRATWDAAPITLQKELARFRAFLNYAVSREWIVKNPAKSLSMPSAPDNPTLPFTDDEVGKIFKNADFRTSVFFRVLLHSGLRIIDAAQLRPEKVNNGRIFLYTQKTKTPVFVPIPPDLQEDLKKLKLVGGFYFAVQSEKPESIAEYYRVKLKEIDEAFRPHRFRDTFAVRLLEKGVPLETVSTLLGHTDIKTTQKSYAPWVKSLQDNLEIAVQKTWKPALALVKR